MESSPFIKSTEKCFYYAAARYFVNSTAVFFSCNRNLNSNKE